MASSHNGSRPCPRVGLGLTLAVTLVACARADGPPLPAPTLPEVNAPSTAEGTGSGDGLEDRLRRLEAMNRELLDRYESVLEQGPSGSNATASWRSATGASSIGWKAPPRARAGQGWRTARDRNRTGPWGRRARSPPPRSTMAGSPWPARAATTPTSSPTRPPASSA